MTAMVTALVIGATVTLGGITHLGAQTREHAVRDTLRIVHVGDINLARNAARQYILVGRGDEVFAGLRDELRRADLAMGNLESVLIDRGAFADPQRTFVFAGPAEGALLLRDAGFDFLATANNHAWDFGLAALVESSARLDSVGIAHAGTGRNLDEAWQPAVFRAKGWTVAVFSLTKIFNAPGLVIDGHPATCCVAWADTLRLRDAVREARDSIGADIVLLTLHHGTEYRGVPLAREREFAQALARTGVDALIGHHPHVPQGVEYVGTVPVMYSLGNTVFLQNDPWTRVGFMADLVFAPDGSRALTMRPLAATFTPAFLSGADSATAMRHLDSLSRALVRPIPANASRTPR